MESLSLTPAQLAILGVIWAMFVLSAMYFVDWVRDRIYPPDPYEWLKARMPKNIKYKHSDIKQIVQGKIVGIGLANEKNNDPKKTQFVYRIKLGTTYDQISIHSKDIEKIW